MRWNTWLSVVLVCLTAVAAKAAEVAITLPADTPFTARLEDAKTGRVLSGPSTSKGTSVRLDTGDTPSPGTWRLVVEDSTTGNVAWKSIPKGPVKPVALSSGDFNRIARVVISVTDRQGKIPSRAAVGLKDGSGIVRWQNLGPEDQGKAVFRDVPAGDGEVRVQQGSPSNYQSISFRLPQKREKPVLEFTADVTLPDGMETTDASTEVSSSDAIGAKQENAGKEPDKATPPAKGTGYGNFLGVLLGFALVGLALWFGYRALRKRGLTAVDALKAAGVQLPDDAPPAAPMVPAEPPTPVDPNTCPYCGRPKDPVTGACACAFTPGPKPEPAANAVREPRLVVLSGSRLGSVIPINTPVAIGRDPGQDFAITDDPAVSRRHAILTPGSDGCAITDQGSSNGTFVNGRRIQSETLRPGDEIAIGSSRFRYEAN